MTSLALLRAFVVAVLAIVVGPGSALAEDLASLVRAGRALYRGEVALSSVPTVEGVPLPGSRCSACHGSRGEARREAGVAMPPIQWQALQQPRDSRPALGSDDAVLRALEQGLGRAEKLLQAPMPRYTLTPTERRALLAYLRVLATDADPVPGVGADRIVVSSVLPLSGPQAAVGERVRTALATRFDAVNAAGGVFGRHIELRAVDGGPTTATASAAALALLNEPGDGVFAFVGSLLAEPDAALRAALAAKDVPMVATLGVPAHDAAVSQLTYLLPSVTMQVRQLVASLARQCGTPEGAALVLYPSGTRFAQGLVAAMPALQLRSVADEAALRNALVSAPRLPVVALLPPERVAQLRVLLPQAGSPACLGTLAVVTGPSAETTARPLAPARAMTDLLALPMPPLADEPNQVPGAALWATLGDTAARVFVEALSRSGRAVDATRFASALETLHRFEPVAGLSVTFSPTQRHGFDVATLSRENSHATPPR